MDAVNLTLGLDYESQYKLQWTHILKYAVKPYYFHGSQVNLGQKNPEP